jgi:hypothetical protein
MAKVGPLNLMSGAAIAAIALGVLVACAHDKAGQTAQTGAAPIPDRPDWNWDVRPVLSQNCFACHGQGTQKAGLRLDIEKAAYDPIPEDRNKRAVVPGNPGRSELFKRITSSDADYRMPPKDSHKTLSPREIAIVEKWIKQGAHYKQHWSYIQPAIVKPEKTKWDKQAVNPIDRYVYATLAKEGLSPSPEADRETLINRVTLDLTGLPPTLREVDAFVADKSPDAYEHLVDKLLSSKEYAERQTNIWMDVARYADTRGGLNDGERSISFPYRDWVISAFQRNLPYDKFVTWQLAGDKLNNNNPTREQLLATAFLKEGRQDSEGGSIDEEFRINYVQERTELIGKDFLGLTVGCAKCHNHKYDVIAQADYYSMSGFFNQMDERGGGGGSRGTPQGPYLDWPTAMQTKRLTSAHANTVAAQTAYDNALRVAQARAGATAVAADAQRTTFIKTAIDADTQAYYPFDDGYKSSFESLMIDEQPQFAGVIPKDPKSPLLKLTRAEAIAVLQKQILADVKAGKPPPMMTQPDPGQAAFAGVAPDKAGGKPGGKPGAHPPGTHAEGGPGGPAGGGLMKTAAPGAPHAGPGPIPGMHKASLPGAAGAPGAKPGAPGAKPAGRGRRGGMQSDLDAMKADPGLPRLASREADWALEQIIAAGYTDERLGNTVRVIKRQLKPGLKAEELLWTKSGVTGGEPGLLNNVKFVPGVHGMGVQLHDSVVAAAKGVGMFERTQPYSLDFWVKLRAGKPYVDSTRPEGPAASVLYNSGGVNGQGYEIGLVDGKLDYSITHNAPYEQLKISTASPVPTGRWVHVTTTYDGNSKAGGMRFYIDGKLARVVVQHDHLTMSAMPGGGDSLFGGYFGLSAGTNFNRPELVDGAMDELRVVTRALTPLEVAYLQDPKLAAAAPQPEARKAIAEIEVQKDPAVAAAWQALTDARLAEQRATSPIYKLMVAGDQQRYRKTYVLDRGVYNAYMQEVKPQGIPRVFPWSDKLPRDRLGLAEWLFDPKQPLTARVYVNRMWQNHFGSGIVQTVDDFGTQGAIPTHPELLDYLAVEFVRSGWDMRHMHKMMVMSATYRQNSNVSREALEKDPRNFLLERGPRFRMPAELIRDNALKASGLLLNQVGGDAVYPYAPDAIWDGAATGEVVYPTNVPADQNHRRSMYTFIKRNAPVANLVPFDMPDRYNATVMRPISNTPLQGLVMLNDTQFMEAYRKLAERAIKASASEDQQITTLWRLAVRRSPLPAELSAARRLLASEQARMLAKPDEVKKLLAIGVAPVDASVDPAKLAAMTIVTAGVMNTPDAYTLR